MIDRRWFRYFDWIGFCLTVVIVTIGLLFVFSSTYQPERPISIFLKKQLFGVVTGLMIYIFMSIKDLRPFMRISYFGYLGILLLLVYTIVGGWIGMGAQRWISLYFIRFQPSELVKFCFPMFIAYYFSQENRPNLSSLTHYTFSEFLIPLAVLFISFVLVLKQPDLGTALIILFSGFILFWFIGLSRMFFITLALVASLSTPLLWKGLKPYQQKRILVLLGHGDKQHERYQIEQSKIAIGSGGLTGKGFLKGTQSKLRFLPEDHTDFIFAVLCEEWGFVGALSVLLLFFLLFARLLWIISSVNVLELQIVGLGMLIHLMLSVVINIGMVIGLLPIVGIPLPLMSYGITNLWICFASLGWLNNLAIRRYYY